MSDEKTNDGKTKDKPVPRYTALRIGKSPIAGTYLATIVPTKGAAYSAYVKFDKAGEQPPRIAQVTRAQIERIL